MFWVKKKIGSKLGQGAMGSASQITFQWPMWAIINMLYYTIRAMFETQIFTTCFTTCWVVSSELVYHFSYGPDTTFIVY